MKIELTEKQTVKLLILVRHYINSVLKGSRLPVRQESLEFYEKLYDDLGRQLPDHSGVQTRSHSEWISCIERLPEPLQNVIVCTDINTVTVAWLNGDHWTFANTGNGHTENWSFDAVKYWMNLPEPPEKE